MKSRDSLHSDLLTTSQQPRTLGFWLWLFLRWLWWRLQHPWNGDPEVMCSFGGGLTLTASPAHRQVRFLALVESPYTIFRLTPPYFLLPPPHLINLLVT